MYEFKLKREAFGRYYLSAPRDEHIVRTAWGLLGAAKEMPITIDSAGFPDAKINDMCVAFSFGTGIFCFTPGLDAGAQREPENADDYMYLKERFLPMVTTDAIRKTYSEDETALVDGKALWGGTWMGHAVPSFVDFAALGTDGMREKIKAGREKNGDCEGFYDALDIVMDAIDILGERFCVLAEEKSKQAEGKEKDRLIRLSRAMEHCPKKPARDFFEAVAVFVMVFSFDGLDSPGHFDQYMIDFYRKSDPDDRREILVDLWEFFHRTRSWNLCISGSDENWNDLTNELTYDILDVTRILKYQTPNLTMRCHRNTPDELYEAAAKTLATGCGIPAIYNDEVVCPALESIGISPRHAHMYVMNGCNQIDIQGVSHMGLEDGEVNLARALEFAFNKGVCTFTGKKLGADTPDSHTFDTFDKLYDAFVAQMEYLCHKAAELSNRGQEIMARMAPNPFRSAIIEGCIEKGIDYKNGGPVYGHGQMLAEGIANAVDSLAAMKHFVYDTGEVSLNTMLDALNADFEGYDELRKKLSECEYKFGNDIEWVDNIASDIMSRFFLTLQSIPTFRGGYFGGGCSPFNRASENGRRTGSLPDGHKKWDPMFADSIGAVPGNDQNGPTALLSSCMRYNQKLATSGFVLNLKFDKELFGSDIGREGFISLWKTYFSGGGQQLSVSVVSREELLDAKIHPECHRDLIVRVGGYSDYFVNLDDNLQDNVIARTAY